MAPGLGAGLADAAGAHHHPARGGRRRRVKPIIDKVNAAVVRIAADPVWREKNFIDRAVEPATGPREEFLAFIDGNRRIAAAIARTPGCSRNDVNGKE